jgi:hypothetical protein
VNNLLNVGLNSKAPKNTTIAKDKKGVAARDRGTMAIVVGLL